MAAAVLRHHLTTELGSAHDVVEAVTFLSSEKACFVNGQIWLIDGGLLSHVPYFADALDGWPEPVVGRRRTRRWKVGAVMDALETLVAIEGITQLKARYFRTLRR